MIRYYMGVDPGMRGAAVVIGEPGFVRDSIQFEKATEREVWQWFNNWGVDDLAHPSLRSMIARCWLEQVHAIPRITKEGKRISMGAQTSFKFGKSYGLVRGFLVAAQIPFENVVPSTWQGALGLRRAKRMSQTDHKRQLRQRAQELYPGERVTNATADAILLAHLAFQEGNK